MKINIKEGKDYPIDKIKDFQGKVKDVDFISIEKLKNSILDRGFSEKVVLYKENESDDFAYCVSGNQRIKALKELIKEKKINVTNVPCNWSLAKSLDEAKKDMTVLAGQYGYVDKDELMIFMEDNKIDVDFINKYVNFPEIELQKKLEETTESLNKLQEELDEISNATEDKTASSVKHDHDSQGTFDIVFRYKSEEQFKRTYQKFKSYCDKLKASKPKIDSDVACFDFFVDNLIIVHEKK